MSKGGYFLDFSEFNERFRAVAEKHIPAALEKGLFNAMNELLRDSIVEAPQAPFKLGDLHGSRFVKKSRSKKTLGVRGGFNIKYAMRHHEVAPGTYRYTLTHVKNPGPKFMESKMIRNKEKYWGILTETIKERWI